MKIVKANGKNTLIISKDEWIKIGNIIEAKKKGKYKHSPMEHGFIDECIRKNQDKDDPGAYCASIVDKAKGSTKWREKKD